MSACRLCLGYTATMDIFFHDRRPVLNKFINYSRLKIQKHDGLPEKICLDCILKMEATVAFISKCEDNDRELRNKVHKIKDEKSQDIFDDPLLFNIEEKAVTRSSKRQIPIKTEVKIEVDSDYDDSPLEFLDDDVKSDSSHDVYQDVFFKNPPIKKGKKKTIKKTISKVNNKVGHLCNICGEYFAPKSKLSYKNHMLTHGEKQFKCTKCPKEFFTRRKFTAHGRAHVETKNFICDYCGKAFKCKKSILGHIEFIHIKKVQYTCEHCKRAFLRPDYFKRHLSQMHQIEQNYVCRTCNKSFPFLDLFQLHKLVHTGEKDFPCKSCPARFISEKLLTDHQKTHTDELKFHCKICYKGYSQQHFLKTHMTKLHKYSELDIEID